MGLGNRRTTVFISREQKSKTEDNWGVRVILDSKEHRKSKF